MSVEETPINDVSDAVKEFIRHYIRSVHQLEILMWLKNHREGGTAERVSRELYTSEKAVAEEVKQFVRVGFVTATEQNNELTYTYKVTPSDKVIDELFNAYRDFRVRIIQLIFSRSSETLRSFSDAFRLRSEEESQ